MDLREATALQSFHRRVFCTTLFVTSANGELSMPVFRHGRDYPVVLDLRSRIYER